GPARQPYARVLVPESLLPDRAGVASDGGGGAPAQEGCRLGGGDRLASQVGRRGRDDVGLDLGGHRGLHRQLPLVAARAAPRAAEHRLLAGERRAGDGADRRRRGARGASDSLALGRHRARARGALAAGQRGGRAGAGRLSSGPVAMGPVGQVVAIIGQLCLKHAMAPNGEQNGEAPIAWRWLVPGVTSFAVWFFLWLGLLSQWDVSQVYPFDALNATWIALAARVVLNERLPARGW